jgi:NAD(P)-dependent dehydrogenase (short-subunit alcohol dehydrogenase family)
MTALWKRIETAVSCRRDEVSSVRGLPGRRPFARSTDVTLTVVVTGSTRGLGYGLTEAFLALGCNAVVNGRSAEAVQAAAKTLAQKHGAARLLACPADVCEGKHLRALWDAAVARFGRVDVWINNAGSGSQQVPFLEQSPELVANVVRTNLVGAVLGTRIALEGMTRQGGGQIFNVEGLGSNPRAKRTGMAVYGATKCATRYFTQSVVNETKGGPVRVGSLFPGVLVTDMLLGQFDGARREAWEKARGRYNKVGDRVETVAPVLAQRILSNDRHGAYIGWISIPKMLLRLLLPSKRDLFAGVPSPRVVE